VHSIYPRAPHGAVLRPLDFVLPSKVTPVQQLMSVRHHGGRHSGRHGGYDGHAFSWTAVTALKENVPRAAAVIEEGILPALGDRRGQPSRQSQSLLGIRSLIRLVSTRKFCDWWGRWRGTTVMTDLLICVCKSDQLPFGPRTSKKLKTNGQIFVDETHRHYDNRPLRGRAYKR